MGARAHMNSHTTRGHREWRGATDTRASARAAYRCHGHGRGGVRRYRRASAKKAPPQNPARPWRAAGRARPGARRSQARPPPDSAPDNSNGSGPRRGPENRPVSRPAFWPRKGDAQQLGFTLPWPKRGPENRTRQRTVFRAADLPLVQNPGNDRTAKVKGATDTDAHHKETTPAGARTQRRSRQNRRAAIVPKPA